MRQQIVELQNAAAFFGAQVAEREQAAEPAPAGAVARIDENVGRAFCELQPRARLIAQGQILLALGQMRAHHAGERIAVAQAESSEPNAGRLHHQLLGMRGAAQEGEIRGDREFDVTHHSYARGLARTLTRTSRAGTRWAPPHLAPNLPASS